MPPAPMKNYVLDRGLWVPGTHVELEDKAAKFERYQRVAAELVKRHAELGPAGLMAMALTGQQSQIDKIQVGFSPRFTAITAGALARKGVGILVAVTLTAAAGANTQLWDGTVGSGNQLFNGPTTLGPGTYWLYAAFANDLNYVIATAVTDMVVITAGI